MHHPWLLLALVPLGAVLWWAHMSLREINAIQHENRRMRDDLERRFPWLREDGERHE